MSAQTRNSLGRLNATDPAAENLTFDGDTVTWLRGGTSPEVWRTSFDASTNGTNWINLDSGERVSGGWQLTGLNLPTNASLRARGFVAGGRYGCSTWFQERVIGPTVIEPPVILVGPSSRTNNGATVAHFGVDAAGSLPLSYQWRKDGAVLLDMGPISGVNKPTLTLNNVSAASSGDYSVTVSNYSGIVTSALAKLVVVDPFISIHPASRTNNAGSYAQFGVLAGGSSPVSYAWYWDGLGLTNGGIISGATATNLALSGVLGGDGGSYFLVASNHYGSVTSQVATLTVRDPFITAHPVNQFTNAGESVRFDVSAVGTDLTYQWRKNGVDLPGATAATLVLTNVQLTDQNVYSAAISNQFGSITSLVATLSLNLAVPDSLNPGANGGVSALALQRDGKVLVGGGFTSLGEELRNRIGRLGPDGALDTNFSASATGFTGASVSSLAIQPDGMILVGGFFSLLNGSNRTNIGRLDTDGSTDTAFNPGANDTVLCLCSLSGGRILVGGNFTMIVGRPRNRIAMLKQDGTLDSDFVAEANGGVNCLAVQPDGRIVVGGIFSSINGQPCTNIARLEPDGSLDSSFRASVNSQVNCLTIQPDGKIVLGGWFWVVNGESRRRLARLLPDGSLDLAFDPGVSTSTAHAVHSLVLQADGMILIGGYFSAVSGQARRGLARLAEDGSLDPTFDPPVSSATGKAVTALSLQADGRLLVGGNFSTLAGVARNNIGRLSNSSVPGENLFYNGSRLVWERSGTGPEFWSVNFEFTTNSLDWMLLGDAARISSGWQSIVTGLATNTLVRARGMVAAGQNNGSGWILERTLLLAPGTTPRIFPEGSLFGFISNRFGFDVSGLAGQVAVVESSTNLVDWLPLATNLITTGRDYFGDVEARNWPVRFYRLRLQE